MQTYFQASTTTTSRNHHAKIFPKKETFNYLASEGELEEEIEDSVRYSGAERVLQVHFVPLEHLVRVLGAPPHHHPSEVVFDHAGRGVRHVALFDCQTGIDIVSETLGQFLDDDRAVGDFFSVQFDERQLALLGTVLHFVVHVLENKKQTLNSEIHKV